MLSSSVVCRATVIALPLSMTLFGCAPPLPPPDFQMHEQLIYVLPGIEGPSRNNRNIVQGLKDGGVDANIEVFDWATPAGIFNWFAHLTDQRRNRRQAIRLARTILAYQKKYPDHPIFLVAHSGGAGIALSAVELLPETAAVEGVILLAAAVSPDHDLNQALARTRRGIWNFYSRRDVGFLVLGTSLLGTMDRKYTSAAGAVGFRRPADLDSQQVETYQRKLHDISYRKEMRRDRNYGTHNGWTHPRFVARWLAPIVLDQPMPPAESAASD